MITRFVCPFCAEAVCESTIWTPPARIERLVREHVLARHPIRWRLNMVWRRAMKATA